MLSERDNLLFELEQRLARVGRKLSAEEASAIIKEDFVEFGSSGKIWSRPEIIAALAKWEPTERMIEDFHVRKLSPSLCLVTYKSSTSGRPSFTLRSSLWRNDGGMWRIVFHQGTAVK
jgi:hypothetical protein